MTHTPASDSDREERLNEVLLTYVEALQAGERPDRQQLLALHPDLRDELELFFASHDEVERRAAPLRGGGSLMGWPFQDVLSARTLRSAAISSPLGKDDHRNSRAQGGGAPEIGRLGDFRLLREVGRGGMGVVYEAEQISLQRRVALKVLPFAAAVDPRQLQRFKNEALAAANLRHEGIVPVHAVGAERGVHYYAMPFIDGQSLAALIRDLRRLGGDPGQPAPAGPSQPGSGAETAGPRCPTAASESRAEDATSGVAVSLSRERSVGGGRYFDWVAGLGRQAALALEHAHQTGIVHRDIKPANLLLDPQGQLWVTDFGLAQVVGESGLTVTGELLGTLRYASPEQARVRQGVVDHRSDIYSLGATLYELLTLRPVFPGRDGNELLRQIAHEEPRPPRSVHPAVPAELETIVLKALSKDPGDRYATAQELADDLQRFREDRPILARRPTSWERLRKWTRRHPSVVVAGVVVLILLSAASLVSTALIHRAQQRTKEEQTKAEEAYRRERERAEEAEARFRVARRSVDELVRVSEEELAAGPGMEALRKRLLTVALGYYLEFIEQRQDDPTAQADLLDTKRRVERILDDVAVLRAASQWNLLSRPAVLDDLRLSREQREKVKEFVAHVERQWLESFPDMIGLTPAERGHQFLQQARADEAEVNAILTREHLDRLRQIRLQLAGPAAFRDPEVAAALELTPEQRDRIRAIEEEWLFVWTKKMRDGRGLGSRAQPTEPQGKPAHERILALLTEEQARRWQSMIGEPFRGLLIPFPLPHGPLSKP
jgi:serine/threonine protein kinase